jgi:O-antigen ligase
MHWFPQSAPPASSFINRNFFAEYLVCTLPISVFLLANLRKSHTAWAMAGTIAFNAVGLLMTGTQSALLALWVMLPVLCVVGWRYGGGLACSTWSKRQSVGVLLVFAIGILGLGSLPTGNAKLEAENPGTTALKRSLQRTASIAKASEYTEGSFSVRSVMWKATARMVADNPWTGVGAGAWDVHIARYQGANHSVEIDFFAHNEWLQLLSEYCVLVGGLFIAFLLAYALHAAQCTWQLRGADVQEAPLRAMALSSLLALFVVSAAGFPWHMASTSALLALCLAVLAASDARLGRREAGFSALLHGAPSAPI